MGLDAHVRCNCAKEGKTKPFPFPGRLAFDECGEPYLADTVGGAFQDMPELMRFDQWESNQGCEHGRFLVHVHIGNASSVGFIREWIKTKQVETGRLFPVLLEKVVYSGTHAGDCLKFSDARTLMGEVNILEAHVQDDYHREFVRNIRQLCDASLATGNPIAF